MEVGGERGNEGLKGCDGGSWRRRGGGGVMGREAGNIGVGEGDVRGARGPEISDQSVGLLDLGAAAAVRHHRLRNCH